MARANKIGNPFEQSFMFHMIRDFFLLLLLVATAAMGIRYAALRYDYATKAQGRIDQAAQTVYPILNRKASFNLNATGLQPTLGSLNRDLEQTVDGLREGAYRAADGTMQEQAAQYRALAQTLREMALLEANMQNIAQSGQQVVHRLTHVAAT